MNQYFSNDQGMIVQNHVWVKDPLKEQNRPMDFNVIEYKKLTNMVLDLIF